MRWQLISFILKKISTKYSSLNNQSLSVSHSFKYKWCSKKKVVCSVCIWNKLKQAPVFFKAKHHASVWDNFMHISHCVHRILNWCVLKDGDLTKLFGSSFLTASLHTSEICVGKRYWNIQWLVQFCVPALIPAKEPVVLLTIAFIPSRATRCH